MHHHHGYSAQGQVLHCKLRNQGCSSAQRQISTTNLGTQVAVLLGMDRCDSFPNPTLSLASEQTLKDAKGHQPGDEESEYGYTGTSRLH